MKKEWRPVGTGFVKVGPEFSGLGQDAKSLYLGWVSEERWFTDLDAWPVWLWHGATGTARHPDIWMEMGS